ncbi:hypothetical protein EK21DRAFT_115409 [Setomelanomma holmii]|uniref:Uncharacterized protein n=1 Tax=Setomelanomma holmii TaxID=210430 RepID=A0A9P4H394_9PLEO|nr:hypothetical protein EK21DRAFT_115409 [Setomelanomma holmii]
MGDRHRKSKRAEAWIKDKNPLRKKTKPGQTVDTPQQHDGPNLSWSDNLAAQYSIPAPPPPHSMRQPCDADGNYTGPEYFFDEKTRALQRRMSENQASGHRDFSNTSSTVVQVEAFYNDTDENDELQQPSHAMVPWRPFVTNPDPLDDQTQINANPPDDAERAQQLSQIETYLLGTKQRNVELAGPESESAVNAIMRILAYYEQRSLSWKDPQKELATTAGRRTENVKALDELRATNTTLLDNNKKLVAENKRVEESHFRLENKIMGMDAEIKRQKATIDYDAQEYNKQIAQLKFQNSQLESSHTARLRNNDNAKQAEIDAIKRMHEELLRKTKNDAASARYEAQQRQDSDRKAIEELKGRIEGVNRDWRRSYDAWMVEKRDMQHQLKIATSTADTRVQENDEKWERKVYNERKDREDQVKSLQCEVTRLNKIIDDEKSNKEAALRSQERKLKEQHQEETVELRTVIEDFKVASSRREHFKGLTDSEMAAHYKRLANNIEDVSRMEWDFSKEQKWPLTESRMREHSNNTRKLKQQIIQHTLWSLLFEHIFRSPFCIMGGDVRKLDAEFAEIYSSGASSFHWPEVSVDIERSRFETAKAFLDAIESSAGVSPAKQTIDESITTTIDESITTTMNAICGALVDVAKVQTRDRKGLEGVVRFAVKIWLESCSQRYRLIVVLPEVHRHILTPGFVENGGLRLVVRPDVKRYGDSHGKDLMRGESLAGWKGLSETYSADYQ